MGSRSGHATRDADGGPNPPGHARELREETMEHEGIPARHIPPGYTLSAAALDILDDWLLEMIVEDEDGSEAANLEPERTAA